MASSSSVSVFDNHRFKSSFNKELYNSIVKNKKVITECCINLNDDEYPEIKEQLSLRGKRRLAAPKQEISIDLIHEFYANAILTEEGNEEENEGQAHDYDYHNQPDHENYQPDFEQHHEFNEPPVQQSLHNDPTYTDQHKKDLESIECQLQNMMWY
ncbi:hypothetical protein PIB30_114176, partial [Stylosanthes scabra]|nr:hypothetical protein [Stylosanthes scabra]